MAAAAPRTAVPMGDDDRDLIEGRRLRALLKVAPNRHELRELFTPEQQRQVNLAWSEEEREIAAGWAARAAAINAAAAEPPQVNGAQEPRPRPHAKAKSEFKRGTAVPRQTAATGFSQGRANQRRADLWAVHRHDLKDKRKVTAATYAAFMSRLAAAFPGRDVLDPDSITPAELGAHLKITFAVRIEIEKEETDYRVTKGWKKSGAKPYRLRTILPCDKTAEEVERHYHQVRSEAQAERRKAARAARAELHRQQHQQETAKMTQTHTTQESPLTSYTDLLAAQVAHTRSQISALRQVVDGEFRTLADLIARVRTHPNWREVDEAKLRQTVVDRLHAMGDEIENTYMRGRRGTRVRLVRRCRPNPANLTSQDHRTV